MELKEFITSTLKQIIQGVADAQSFARENHSRVNPSHRNPSGYKSEGTSYHTETIEFDVAVTTTEGTDTSGKISIATGILNLGSGGASSAEKQSINRIKFSVPVELPVKDRED